MVSAFFGREGDEEMPDTVARRVDRSPGSFSQPGLELGEELFDGNEVG
ncbi:MAG: hypothetical protein IH906_06370 [Proteobacteria bacterium]|nr:hypothetical protein [Pseudomonadota bacterium]